MASLALHLPTLGDLVERSRRTAARFPFVLACGAIAAWAGLGVIDELSNEEMYRRVLAAASLGLPLSFALTMFAERRLRGSPLRWALLGGGAIVLLVIGWLWGGWTPAMKTTRYLQLSAVFHLLVAFLPYAGLREGNGFWYYNKALFLRFLTAALYTAVFFAGLAIAFASLDKLFDLDIPAESYFRLWVVMAFVLNTWFFVAGVPEDLAALESRRDYPAGLRVFTQYALLPIVVLYLVLLTVYFAKIIITREWPSGWIGWLVSSVAVTGILSWLLVRPLEEFPEHAWVKSYTRGFYLGIMPAIVMLWFAIGKRIGQYGITEARYFLTVLSLWLAGIAVFYTVRRTRDIKPIPLSLCLVGILTLAGPWGPYSVSLRSQTGRLEQLLATHGVLADGQVRAVTGNVPFEDRRQISGALEYAYSVHGEKGLPAWVSDSVRRHAVRGSREGTYYTGNGPVQHLMAGWGIPYVSAWEKEGKTESFWYSGTIYEMVPISGYQYAIEVDSDIFKDSLPVAGAAYLAYDKQERRIVLNQRGRTLLALPLQPIIDLALARDAQSPRRRDPPAYRIETRGSGAAVLALFTSLSGEQTADSTSVNRVHADVYLRLP